MWDIDNIMFGTFVCSSTKEEPSLNSAFLGQVESTLSIWSFHRVQLPHAAQLPRFLCQDALCDPWSPLFHGCPSMSLLWSLGNRQAFQATCEINWTKEKKGAAFETVQHFKRRRAIKAQNFQPQCTHLQQRVLGKAMNHPWSANAAWGPIMGYEIWRTFSLYVHDHFDETHIATKWKSSVHMT